MIFLCVCLLSPWLCQLCVCRHIGSWS